MSAEGLREAVLGKARGEAAQIVAQARAAVEKEREQAAQQAQRGAAALLAQARLQAEAERQQALAALERETRLEVLSAKNELLDKAFALAGERFRALPAERLRELFGSELEGLDLAGATVLVPPGARALFQSLLGSRAEAREASSLQAGFVVERSDFRLDRSLAARLGELRAELRPRAAELLFGERE
jgi:vacuolar-type H+-ATPase subunit E/Vma4